ncbi:MAG: TSUP family transporter [Acidimicrobiales bacterium]
MRPPPQSTRSPTTRTRCCNPQVAIASDLVSSLVMKPVGGTIHARRGTVHWPLVSRLVAGSVPAALAGAYVLNHLGHAPSVQHSVKQLVE